MKGIQYVSTYKSIAIRRYDLINSHCLEKNELDDSAFKPVYLSAAQQRATDLRAQHPRLSRSDPQLALGQLAAQVDVSLAPRAHDPEQFSMHPVCGQDEVLGQMHDPACPKAIPIPASSRTIETIASFFIFAPLYSSL
jgi:hypothetical protein